MYINYYFGPESGHHVKVQLHKKEKYAHNIFDKTYGYFYVAFSFDTEKDFANDLKDIVGEQEL